MKKVLLFLALFLVSALLVGCFEPKIIVSTIEVVSDESEFDQGFQLSDLNVKVTMSDGTFSMVPLNESMISADDLAKFETEGTHTIAVSYLNAATTFTISIAGEKGDPGENGKEVLLRVEEGFIQWQYVGDTTWTNLIALEALMGTSGIDGANGADGKPTTLRVEGGFIQWQYVGDTTWTNLMATADLVGLTGATGAAGADGANGADGKQVTFQVTAEYIQWQYVGDTTWTNLIALSALRGPAGADGANGTDGVTPTIAISEDGYWVINGTKTTYKASGDSVAPVVLTVTFDPLGGTMPEGTLLVLENVEKGSSLTLPIPTMQGFIFEGWWTGDTINDGRFTNATPVTKNITLYARWDQDYDLISDFFDITRSHNFTVDSSIDADVTMGLMQANYQNSMNFKIYEEAGTIYTYEKQLSQETMMGSLEPEFSDYYEGFYVYDEQMWYALEKYSLDEPWRISSEYGYYEEVNYFEFLDIYRFVKRIDANIYDYPITKAELKELLWNMDIEIGDAAINSSNVYLDLDLMKLVITFNASGDGFDSPEPMTIDCVISFTITNPGLTTIELPLADTKVAAIAMIDEIAANKEQINFAKPESVLAFNNLVLEAKTTLNNATTIFQIIDALHLYTPKLHMFEFEIDPLAQVKFFRIQEMEQLLMERSPMATADSLIQMTDLFNNYSALIQSAINFEQIDILFNEYVVKLDEKYVIDQEKMALQEHINEMNNIFGFYMQSLGQFFASESDYQTFANVYYNYQNLIQKATTIAEVDSLFDEAIVALKALPTFWKPDFSALLGNMTMMIADLMNNLAPALGEDSPIYDQGKALIDHLKTQLTPLLVVDEFRIGYLALEASALVAVRTFTLEHLLNIKEEFAAIIVSEQLAELNNLYDAFVIDANQAEDFWEFGDLLNDFRSECQQFAIDELLETIRNLKQNLIFEFEWFSKTASADSIITMQAVVDQYLPLIGASTTVEEAELTYQSGFQALEAAYVLDPAKAAFMQAQQDATNTIYDWLWYFEKLLTPETMDMIYPISDAMVDSIMKATTISEVEAISADWLVKIQLMGLTAGEYPLSLMKQDIMGNANWLYGEIIDTIDPLPVNFEADYGAFKVFVETTIDIIQLYIQADLYFDGLEDLLTQATIQQYKVWLEEVFVQCQSQAFDSDLPLIQTKYDEAFAIINSTDEQWEAENAYYVFWDFCNNLPKDPIKIQRVQFINNTRESLETYLETATSESATNMIAVFDAYVLEMATLTDMDLMQTATSNALGNIQDAFVPDPAKILLAQTKIDCLNKLNEFVWKYVGLVAKDPTYTNEIMNIIYMNEHMIFEASTVESVLQVCTDIMNMIDKPFEVDPNKVEPYREQILVFINEDYYNARNQFEDIPQPMISSFFDAIEAVGIALTPKDMFDVYTSYTSTLNQQNYAFFQMEVLDYALEVKEIFTSIIVDESIPEIEPAYLVCVNAINNAVVIGDMFFAISTFESYLDTLPTDALKEQLYEAQRDLINFSFNQIHDATDASVAAIEAYVDATLPLIAACTTSEDAYTIVNDASDEIIGLYVRDYAKYNLQVRKYDFFNSLDRFVYMYFNFFYINWNDYIPVRNISDSYTSQINLATSIDMATNLYNEAMNKLLAYEFELDLEQLEPFRENLINDLIDEYYYRSSWIYNIPLTLTQLFMDGKTALETASSPLDIFQAFELYLKQLNLAILAQMKIEQLAAITNQYNYYKQVLVDEDLPTLDLIYAEVAAEFDLCIDANSLDFASRDFYEFVDYPNIDPFKSNVYLHCEYLTEDLGELSLDATDASIVSMKAIYETHLSNIKNATDEAGIYAAYEAGYDALLAAYEQDPAKKVLIDAKDAATYYIWDYTSFVEGFVADWNLHHDMNAKAADYELLINNATTVEEIDLLKGQAITAIKSIEVIDQEAFEEYRTDIIAWMDADYASISEPTQEQTDSYNTIRNFNLTVVAHPYALRNNYNLFREAMFPTV